MHMITILPQCELYKPEEVPCPKLRLDAVHNYKHKNPSGGSLSLRPPRAYSVGRMPVDGANCGMVSEEGVTNHCHGKRNPGGRLKPYFCSDII